MLQFFQKILKESSSLQPNRSQLKISNEAEEKITSQLESRPKGIKSTFKIQIQYEPDRFYVQVGFDEFQPGQDTIFSYPFPLLISRNDELLLRGSKIDYNEEERSFFIFPEVEVEAEDTPKPEIIKFFINRDIISENSPIKEVGVAENSKDSLPFFFINLFDSGLINSLYVKENWVQIELKEDKMGRQSEELIAGLLLDYYEKCSYSLYVKEDKILPIYMV